MASTRYQWLIFAIASGACAAINGTFAKLTTGPFTSSVAASLASLLSVPSKHATIFEYALRALFFALNLSFDALMWGLFTRALTLASSTVHVSVLNTSTNFLVAASAGWMVFGEKLPGLWWVGAGMLVVGCLLIGSREGREGGGKEGGYVRVDGQGQELDGVEGEDVPLGKMGEGPHGSLPGAGGADGGAAARSRSPYRDEDDFVAVR